jgi:glycosyltransferase involved in cell wall biosynthesis
MTATRIGEEYICTVPDVRWFSPNSYGSLVVPGLERRGVSIAREGDAPARLAVAMSATVAEEAWRYARARGCPLAVYLWDLPPWRMGHGRHDLVWSVAGRFLRLPRAGPRFAQRRGFYSRLRYIAAHAAAVWTPSQNTKQAVRRHLGLAATLQPYCYDSTRFVPDPRQRRTPDTLLYISRMQPYKNHEAVLRAAARSEPRAPVRLIGRGPSLPGLQSLAEDLGVPCSFESGLGDEEIVRAYQTAAVVVCPSRFEGFGLTPIEGLACGAPVVASDIPPHREFLRESAAYFTLDNDSALVQAIQAARGGGAGGRGALDLITIEAAADRFAAGLRELL